MSLKRFIEPKSLLENIYPIWDLGKEIIFSAKTREEGLLDLANFCLSNKNFSQILCDNEDFWKSLISEDLEYLGIRNISKIPDFFFEMENPYRKFYLWLVAYGGYDWRSARSSELNSGFPSLFMILCENSWLRKNICDDPTFWKMASHDFFMSNIYDPQSWKAYGWSPNTYDEIDFTNLKTMKLPNEYENWSDYYQHLLDVEMDLEIQAEEDLDEYLLARYPHYP